MDWTKFLRMLRFLSPFLLGLLAVVFTGNATAEMIALIAFFLIILGITYKFSKK